MPTDTSVGVFFSSISGFMLIVGVGLVIGLIFVLKTIFESFSAEDAQEMGLGIATMGAIVITVMTFVCMFCSTIYPTERFESLTPPTLTDNLMNGITVAEQKVCELIQRTDKYIESDLGKPGQDDPSLVVAAQKQARAVVPGERLVDCTVGSPSVTLADAAARLTLLENSLKWFTGPGLDSAYKKAMAGCEGFQTVGLLDRKEGFQTVGLLGLSGETSEGFQTVGLLDRKDGFQTYGLLDHTRESFMSDNNSAPIVDLAALQTRLDTVNSEIADQHRLRLDPMDKQQAALKRGEVSDCQKKMGAGAGADAAAAAKRPTTSDSS